MASTSLFGKVLDAVATVIQGLDLDGVHDDEIRVRKHPDDDSRVYPGITVHPAVDWQHRREGTNERDDVGYGVQVTMVQATSQDVRRQIDRRLLWREKIRREFIHQRAPLSSITEVYTCHIEAAPPFNRRDFRKDYDVDSLVIRVWTRETRGN